jgi:hypothetical protein
MPATDSPPPSGDAAAPPADWIAHDFHPAAEGWFIVAHWPGLEIDDTVIDAGYVRRDDRGLLYLEGRVDCLRGLDGAYYVRLPYPFRLPF